ncbi:hypothetical protein KGMB02408_34640 [Bacteroides faecalis]|uniref:Uncharacterized protein n=1 Tax=Bacteroides faecalis TaxID=2447885 RepID=A0A401LYA5_9BACE|nr:hypothetical protein KGMB02408_34640 [Bacteroides faecalis]
MPTILIPTKDKSITTGFRSNILKETYKPIPKVINITNNHLGTIYGSVNDREYTNTAVKHKTIKLP